MSAFNFDDIVSPSQLSNAHPASTASAVCFSDLQPWMDEHFILQVCNLKGWTDVQVKINQTAPDPSTGQTFMNPGYCVVLFPHPSMAENAISSIMNHTGGPPLMPNSNNPFNLSRWNPNTHPMSFAPTAHLHPPSAVPPAQPQEWSIFVGDLASDASNTDLVNVFRNPNLGLRDDREPRAIRPFLSCKSAKIQLDPVTGLSRGYGFVRFTDEEDQKRALVEMHGLYCLSRPMRISAATAKSRSAPAANSVGGSSSPGMTSPSPAPNDALRHTKEQQQKQQQPAPGPFHHVGHLAHLRAPPLPPQPQLDQASITQTLAAISSLADQPRTESSSITGPLADTRQRSAPFYQVQSSSTLTAQRAQNLDEDRLRHDAYNTTVFVGGLSPLIPEETLRSFFSPFGEIHYVKVPVGKHCGFVQFVRKADAERAIDRMQGFHLAGSKIRLSWGRSQYKAIQAAVTQSSTASMPSPSTPTPPVATPFAPSPVVPAAISPSQPSTAASGSKLNPEDTELFVSLLATQMNWTRDQARLFISLRPPDHSTSQLTGGNRLHRGAAGGSIGDGQQFFNGGANNNGLYGGLLPHHLFSGVDSMSDNGIDELENDLNLGNQRLLQTRAARSQSVSPYPPYNGIGAELASTNGFSAFGQNHFLPNDVGPLGTPMNSLGGSGGVNNFLPYSDDLQARAGMFNANDILRHDSQPLPRAGRGSFSGHGSPGASQPFGGVGIPLGSHKSTVDNISSSMAGIHFNSNPSSIWTALPGGSNSGNGSGPNGSHGSSTSPTLVRNRNSGSPGGSSGGAASNNA